MLKRNKPLQPDISIVANLIGEPARAKMLTALMTGKALTATELALEAEVTAQTASSHLAKLLKGELLVVRKQGRHKYFQLRSVEVAELVEKMLNLSASVHHNSIKTGPVDQALRHARVCYDHLAGEQGVALFDALLNQGIIAEETDQATLTDKGLLFFSELGVDFKKVNQSKRPVCKACLDWSERRNHLAGQLGAWMLNYAFEKNWAKRDLTTRAIHFSAHGKTKFANCFGIKQTRGN